jgi:2,3,4,5-tetrahydropyridine-2-carboxylate N-succinyltransferase
MHPIQALIEESFERRADITPATVSVELKSAIEQVIDELDSGHLRVAEKIGGEWFTHQWVKKAVLLSFRIRDNAVSDDGVTRYFDKVPTKFGDWTPAHFQQAGFRVVPNAMVRKGSFIAKNVVLMPSYVNIGAYVDEGTMVDTWSTVGSCAQIGKNVHRRQLFHRCPLRNRRGCDCGTGLGDFDGRLHWPVNPHLRSRNG